MAFELERDGLHIGKRHGDGDAGFEAGDAEEVVAASPLLAAAEGVEGHPELRLADGSEGEGLREHSDDGVGDAAEGDGLADDVFSSGESFLPGVVAEDDGVGCAGLVFAGGEVAAKDGCDAEGAEEASGDVGSVYVLCAGGRGEEVGVVGIDVECAEDFVEALPVEVVLVGEIGAGKELCGLGDVDQGGGVGVGQRADERGVHKGEDGGAGSDAEREHEDRGEGEAEISAELAEGVEEVLKGGFEPEADGLVGLLLEDGGVAELAGGCAVGGFGGMPSARRSVSFCSRWKAISSSSSLTNFSRRRSIPIFLKRRARESMAFSYASCKTRPMAAIIWSNCESSRPSCLRPVGVRV